MIDPFTGHGATYDVAADVRTHIEEKLAAIAAGTRANDVDLRKAGGMLISPLGTVLLEHLVTSHLRVATSADSGAAYVQATTCARRAIEYIATLEAVALHPYSIEDGDTPLFMLGLAAATLERLAEDFTRNLPAEPTETTLNGISTFRMLATRLRAAEANIGVVAGMHGESAVPVELPNG